MRYIVFSLLLSTNLFAVNDEMKKDKKWLNPLVGIYKNYAGKTSGTSFKKGFNICDKFYFIKKSDFGFLNTWGTQYMICNQLEEDHNQVCFWTFGPNDPDFISIERTETKRIANLNRKRPGYWSGNMGTVTIEKDVQGNLLSFSFFYKKWQGGWPFKRTRWKQKATCQRTGESTIEKKHME